MRRSLMRRVRALGTFCSGHAFDYIGDRAIFVEPQSDSISQLSELAYLLLILQNAVGRCLVGKFPTASFDAAKRRVEVCRIQTCQQKVSPVKRRDLVEGRNHIISRNDRSIGSSIEPDADTIFTITGGITTSIAAHDLGLWSESCRRIRPPSRDFDR